MKKRGKKSWTMWAVMPKAKKDWIECYENEQEARGRRLTLLFPEVLKVKKVIVREV